MVFSSELCIEQLLPKDGNALLYKGFLDSTDADSYLSILNKDVSWKHEPIKLFGKSIN